MSKPAAANAAVMHAALNQDMECWVYPPLWHEVLTASLPLMLECGVFVPFLPCPWVKGCCEILAHSGIAPVGGLAIEEDVMEYARYASASLTWLRARALLLSQSDCAAFCRLKGSTIEQKDDDERMEI